MLRVIFAGTPAFAATALQALHEAGFTIPLVLSQPDRPAGRGLKLQPSAVKAYAQSHGLPVLQPPSLRLAGKYPAEAATAQQAIAAAQADVMVVAAYGLILPQWTLDLPRLGCVNIHASLLPRWRGAAPIHRAVEAGDSHTGITLMQMDVGLDTGAMLAIATTDISSHDTTGSLHNRLATLGAQSVVDLLQQAARTGQLPKATQQPEAGVSYAAKIDKSEALLNWAEFDAATLARRIRAFNPAPGASSYLQATHDAAAKSPPADTLIKFWNADAVSGAIAPADTPAGTILAIDSEAILISASQQTVLRATHLQKPGGKLLPAADFLRGFALAPGMRFR